MEYTRTVISTVLYYAQVDLFVWCVERVSGVLALMIDNYLMIY